MSSSRSPSFIGLDISPNSWKGTRSSLGRLGEFFGTALAVLSAVITPARAAQSISLNERVLIVYNKKVTGSASVAEHYAARRHIPKANRCAISVSDAVWVKWDDLDATIKKPIRKCLEAVGPDKILYIVFIYQTPYRLSVPLANGAFALDQYVADIWDLYAPAEPPATPRFPHPYFAEAQTQGNVYQRFQSLADYRAQPWALKIYSVWRLDGANADLAKGLVDKALAAEASGLSGQACFDRRQGEISRVLDSEYGAGEWDLHAAAQFARQAGFAVIEDQREAEFGTPPSEACPNAALYSGWYKLNNYNDAFTWNAGAIGFHLDSASAVDPRGGTNWSANAILKGITVTSGAVSEPYLDGMAHPDGVFRNLFEGANVGDAFLRNTRWLKWKTLNLGDPLYRPFPGGLRPFNSPGYSPPSLRLSSQSLIGGMSLTAAVTLSSPAPAGGTTFSLRSSSRDLASVDARVTVAAGQKTASFTIITSRVANRTAVRISAEGPVALANTLTLLPAPGAPRAH